MKNMFSDPDDGEDVLAFGDTEHGVSRGRKRLVIAGSIVAAAAVTGIALGVTTQASAPARTAARPQAPAPGLVKFEGVYLQEQSNGTITLPAKFHNSAATARAYETGTATAVTVSAGDVICPQH